MSTITYIILFISIPTFYGLIIWLFHKASVYFHKMDEKVGNTDKAELIFVYNDYLIRREDNAGKKKQKIEEKIKQEIC